MKKRIKDLWIKALRSGEYKKTKYQLCKKGNSFCCLGVLEEIHIQEKLKKNPRAYFGWYKVGNTWEVNGEDQFLSNTTMKWAGIKSSCCPIVGERSLVEINDSSISFEPVIEAIEKHWKEL